MSEIGPMLKKLRREKKLCQKELCRLLNLSIGTISNYENNVHCPDLDTLQKLADYYEVTTDYLLGRTKCRRSPELSEDSLAADCTVSDIVDLVLTLDADSRRHAVSYLNYLKETAGKARKEG